MCQVVQNFTLWRRVGKHTKRPPLRRTRRRTPDLTSRGNSNVPAHAPIIRVLAAPAQYLRKMMDVPEFGRFVIGDSNQG